MDLKPLVKPVLPTLPKRTAHEGPWSARTKSAWAAWRADPASGMYGSAEVQVAIDLAYIYEQWVREPRAALAAEIRQRQDALGLSPKGKQDRRWRVPRAADASEVAGGGDLAEVTPLRVVRGSA